jgi:hypothetical protein
MGQETKDEVINLILQAENDYHDAVEKAVKAAEGYSEDSREKQRVFQDGVKQEWRAFEKAESERLAALLAEAEQKSETETTRMKERLKACQEEHIEVLSERLKKEVLSLHGNR